MKILIREIQTKGKVWNMMIIIMIMIMMKINVYIGNMGDDLLKIGIKNMKGKSSSERFHGSF